MSDPMTSDGELHPRGEVTFRVRPLDGPGTKGPHEVAPESDAPLEQVRAMLDADPTVTLRIEGAVTRMMMGATPGTPEWGAHFAHLVARWFVAHGVDCRRLEPRGFLDTRPDAPPIKVRFFASGRGPARPEGAAADPCVE